MFDTREYEWSDITLIVAGRNVVGFRGVKYSEKQEKEILYAKGSKGHSIQCGNISYEGGARRTASLRYALRYSTACAARTLKGRVSMIVTYGDPSRGEPMLTDRLEHCEFTEDTTEWKQGDKFQEKGLPFIFLDKKSI